MAMAFDPSSHKQFRRFCAQTTLHGFAELQHSSRTRTLWAIMIALMFLTTGFEIYYVINSFVRKPFITNTEPLMVSSMEFPTMKLFPRHTIAPDKFERLSKVIPGIVLRSPPFRMPTATNEQQLLRQLTGNIHAFIWTHHTSSQKELRLNRSDIASVLDTLTYDRHNQWHVQQICYYLLAAESTERIEERIYDEIKKGEVWYTPPVNFTQIYVTRVIEQRYGRAKAGELWFWTFADVIRLTLLKELQELLVNNRQPHAACFSRIMSTSAFGTRLDGAQRAAIVDCIDEVANRTQYWHNVRPYVARGQFDEKRIQLELMFSVDQMLKACWLGADSLNCSQIASLQEDDELGVHYLVRVPHQQTKKQDQLGIIFDTNGRIVRDATQFRQHTISDGIKIGFGTENRLVLAPTRTLTSFELKQTNYDRRATEGFDHCRTRLDEDWVVFRDDHYSYENCQENCVARAVRLECGCATMGDMAELLNITICTAESMRCVHELYHHPETYAAYNMCVTAFCRPACEEVVYDIFFSFHHFPSVENGDQLAHLFQILLYEQIKRHTDAVAAALRSNNHTQVDLLLSDRAEWLVWFEDAESGVSYSYGDDANASHCATTASCLNATQLCSLYSRRPLRTHVQPASADIGLLKNMHQMNRDYIASVTTKAGQEYWSRHYYNLGRFPVQLNQPYGNLSLDDDGLTEYESLDASLEASRLHLVRGYRDIGLGSEFGVRMLQTHDPEKQVVGTSYQCTERRAPDSCGAYRAAVAEQWADDHLLLLVGFQKFEITSVVTHRRSTFNELLGAIGGNFGLFLGGSIISLVHMIACVISWLFPKPETVKKTIRRKYGSAASPQSSAASQPLRGPVGQARRSGGGVVSDGETTDGLSPAPQHNQQQQQQQQQQQTELAALLSRLHDMDRRLDRLERHLTLTHTTTDDDD